MFPHIRSGLPPQPNEVGAVGKRQSSGMNELSPKVEASDMELAKPPMGGNVFSEKKCFRTSATGIREKPGEAVSSGRSGARERTQFCPKGETELSGLCDAIYGGKCFYALKTLGFP